MCCAESGGEGGAQYCWRKDASGPPDFPRSSHVDLVVHRTFPSSTYTWHMGSASTKGGLAR